MTKKIFKSMMLVSAVVFTLGLAFVLGILYQYFGTQIVEELDKEAMYLSQGVEMQGVSYLEGITDEDARITYIAADGTVLFDSQADASTMENHGDRKEVKAALAAGVGNSQRTSATLSERTIYHAIRLDNGNVLRVSSTQFSVLALVYELILPMFWILLLMVILSGIFASRISKKIVEPVNALDLEHPEDNEIYEEVDPLLSKIYRQNRQIKDQLETARRQQEEFEIITENMQEGLLVIDKYTMILSGNASVWRLFHVGKPKTGESIYSLNRSEPFRKVVEHVLEGGHGDTILKLDGNDMQVIANPVERNGHVVGAVLLLVNVTEKVERENLRREFSTNVSHEMKTPLTAISGFAEIIQDGYVQEEDIQKFAGRIYKEAQHLIELVEDVMKISRLDDEEVPYEWENVDLYRLSKNVFGELAEEAKRRNVHFYVGGERTILHTVKPVLEEVLQNICDNAVKYNRDDGSVSILLHENPDEVCITVKDTGMGIPREDQKRVFERFYRVDKSHSKEINGTGLGLSIVKHGVAFLRGSLKMESEEGFGTEIHLSFPKNHAELA